MSVELGMVVRYRGVVHEVIGWSEGRHILLQPVNAQPCPTCGDCGQVDLVEASRTASRTRLTRLRG